MDAAGGSGTPVEGAGLGTHALLPPGTPYEFGQRGHPPGPVGGALGLLVGVYQPQGSLEGGAADVGWGQPEQDGNSPTAPPGGAAGT